MTSSYIIKNMDCIDAMDSMQANSVDLILTDPPYNLGVYVN